ncbi:MAG: DUF6522 family protein [Alphaproteobacteria bacterium]|nr:DUF6522 family protein [Alphaproteobacteria bacterium]
MSESDPPRRDPAPRPGAPTADVLTSDGDGYVIDAAALAPRLGLTPTALQREMRKGLVMNSVERGEGADAGRTRVTFRYRARAWALCIEPDGRVVEVPPPEAGRRPGA